MNRRYIPLLFAMAGRPQKRENKSSKAICFIIILLRSGGSVEQLFYLHELIVVEIACRFVACTGTLLLVKRFDFFEVCGHQRSDTGVGDTRLPHIYTQERNFFFPICFACRMAARYVGTISQRDYCLIIGEGFCRTCLFTGSGRKSAVFDNDGKCSRLNVALGGIELFPLIRSLEQFCQGIVEISIEGLQVRFLRCDTTPYC